MSHLLYHGLARTSADVSPFDDAFLKVADSRELRIVSPYIGVSYLERILATAHDWRLISDVEAWLTSLPTNTRSRAWDFIRNNLDRIHHCEDIHAKCVIGDSLASFGSANLTSRGVLARTELGIFVDEPSYVDELKQWFDGIWASTASPTVKNEDAFVAILDADTGVQTARFRAFASESDRKAIRASLVADQAQPGRQKQTQLDLSSVAKKVVAYELNRHDRLTSLVVAVIERSAMDGFALSEAVRAVKGEFPTVAMKEVYLHLLKFCANHPRSIFNVGTVNRLILRKDGRFIQSSRELLPDAIAPFDCFLAALIEKLNFADSAALPSEAFLQAVSGLDGVDQTILVGELVETGMFSMEDLAGELPRYALAEEYEWSGRFKFLHRAQAAWRAKLNAPLEAARPQRSDDDEEEFPFESDGLAALTDPFAKGYSRHLQKDELMANVIRWLRRGQHVARDTQALISEIHERTSVDRRMVRQLVNGSPAIPAIIEVRSTGDSLVISLNLSLDSAKLAEYPMARKAWKRSGRQ